MPWRRKPDTIYFSTSGRPAIRWPPEATVWDPSSTRPLASLATSKGEPEGAGRWNITSPSLPERPKPRRSHPRRDPSICDRRGISGNAAERLRAIPQKEPADTCRSAGAFTQARQSARRRPNHPRRRYPRNRHRPAEHTCALRRKCHRRDPGRGDSGQRAESAYEAPPVGYRWRRSSRGMRRKVLPQASRKIRLEGQHRKLVRVRAGRVRQRARARQSFAGPAGIAIATGVSSPRTRSHGPAVRSDDGLHRLAAAAPGGDPRLCGRGDPRRRG